MFKYSNTKQSASEIFKSSLKQFCYSLPRCKTSILVGFVYFSLLLMQYEFVTIDKTNPYAITANLIFDMAMISPVLIIYYTQLQAVADNISYSLKDLLHIIVNKFLIVVSIQFVAFVLVLLVAHIEPIIVPFVITPFFIMVPIAIFKANSVYDALKQAWQHTKGSKIYILFSIAFSYVCFKVFWLYMMYQISFMPKNIFLLFGLLIAYATTILFLGALVLNILHNLILRSQDSSIA